MLLRVHQGLSSYREKGSFRWWLKRIITRACLDFWRSARRNERIWKAAAEQTDDIADCGHSSNTVLRDLKRFLTVLSAEDRLVFTLVFLEDRPHREVAELMSISVAAVKVRSFRLRRKAKEWFAV